MNKLTVLDSFVDRIGQEVKVDDIVLYPRIVGKSPELTVAKVISIKQSKTNLVVRIRCIKSKWWGIKKKYPDAQSLILGYETSLTRHANNLIKINADKLNKLEYDVLVQGYEIPVYAEFKTEKGYGEQSIRSITGDYMWSKQ